VNPFLEVAGHTRLCAKCRPVAREIFELRARVKARRNPYATATDYARVHELTGELCAQGARMFAEAREKLARTILQG
jgi:hypothetical protein